MMRTPKVPPPQLNLILVWFLILFQEANKERKGEKMVMLVNKEKLCFSWSFQAPSPQPLIKIGDRKL